MRTSAACSRVLNVQEGPEVMARPDNLGAGLAGAALRRSRRLVGGSGPWGGMADEM